MDWLQRMNDVVAYIEKNLQETIGYDTLSRMAGCSVYEFFRIFSFMTGVPLGEYIRRRRLSQAVFDIQNGDDRVIDIALKWGYESPTSFAKAFKELHGTTPSAARKTGVTFKTYPPLSFKLTIQGVNEMTFKIEKKEAFYIKGQTVTAAAEDMEKFALPSLWSVRPEEVTATSEASDKFSFMYFDSQKPGTYERETPNGNFVIDVKTDGTTVITFTDKDGEVETETIAKHTDNETKILSYFADGDNPKEKEVSHCLSAFDFSAQNDKVKMFIGTEAPCSEADSVYEKKIPAATWAVFSFVGKPTTESVSKTYARILTEWFPTSGYKRDEAIPHLEKIPLENMSENEPWEVWIPVLVK
jgi:AraC-like DNA-binding protein/predicted transcriptional regulator YdeE